MASKIFNKFKEPKPTEFSKKDLVVDVKKGHLYYKSDKGIHKLVSDNHEGNVTVEGTLAINGISNVSASIAAAGSVGGSADNLGNHTATQDLNLNGNNVKNTQHITASGNISASKLITSLTGSFVTGSFSHIVGNSPLTFGGDTQFKFVGHLTASGNLSSSGEIIGIINGGSF